MISKLDKSLIKTLVSSNVFNALVRLQDDMILNWSSQVSEEDQFKYLKACFERDGKIAGVKSFLQSLELIANEDD